MSGRVLRVLTETRFQKGNILFSETGRCLLLCCAIDRYPADETSEEGHVWLRDTCCSSKYMRTLGPICAISNASASRSTVRENFEKRHGTNLNSLWPRRQVLRAPQECGHQPCRSRRSAFPHRKPRPALRLRRSTRQAAAFMMVCSRRSSRYWRPHTTSRRCVSALLRRSCTAYSPSRAHAPPDGSVLTNVQKRFSSSSRTAPLQRS